MSQASGLEVAILDVGQPQADAPRVVRYLRALVRFMQTKRTGGAGLVIVVAIVILAIIGPWVAPYGRDEVFRIPNLKYDINSIEEEALNPTTLQRLDGPSADHPLGTDSFGRDLLTRMILGARLAILVGVVSAALAVTGGLIIGLISGFFGGLVDIVVQRFVDAIIAVPALIFLLLLVQTSEPSQRLTITALSVLGVFSASRVIRSAVLSVRNEVYVDAARVVGARPARIILQHVLPNIAAPAIVVFTISIGANILAEAGLSFLALSEPGPSWGLMVSQGREFIDSKPMMSFVAGGAITITVLAFNLLGDALRDALDPRQRGSR